MKIQVGRNELLTALQSVVGVVERRQTLPVLANFLLEAREDELIVTGTDLEMELVARATVQNLAPGRVTVPARHCQTFGVARDPVHEIASRWPVGSQASPPCQ